MPRSPLRILAFEPYDSGSHRYVRKLISAHSAHKWTWLTRRGRAWKWRMRLAAIELLDEAQERGLLDQPWDIIFTTSLLSAADLRAMLPPSLCEVPLVLYMHENQAAYPHNPAAPGVVKRDVQYALTNLTSILAADLVMWNSRWYRDSFIAGIAELLRLSPDTTLRPNDASEESSNTSLQQRICGRSRILWPPVEPPPPGIPRKRPSLDEPVRVAWPHRWEHDKGPEELLALARRHTRQHNLRWVILGQRHSRVPPALLTFKEEFADRIDQFGYVPDRNAYWAMLRKCDWVLSTAAHEFFGIAVVEALMAGCLPWLPDRLSYPEILPQSARNLSPMDPPMNIEKIRSAIATHLDPAIASNSIKLWDAALQFARA